MQLRREAINRFCMIELFSQLKTTAEVNCYALP